MSQRSLKKTKILYFLFFPRLHHFQERYLLAYQSMPDLLDLPVGPNVIYFVFFKATYLEVECRDFNA